MFLNILSLRRQFHFFPAFLRLAKPKHRSIGGLHLSNVLKSCYIMLDDPKTEVSTGL
jgi:hypothetical protein